MLEIPFVACFCGFIFLGGRCLFLVLGIPLVAYFYGFVLLGGWSSCNLFLVLGILFVLPRRSSVLFFDSWDGLN